VARRIGGSKHALVAVAAVLACIPAPASAAAPAEWTQKAAEIASPWPGLQEPEGRFRDYITTRDPEGVRDDYGDPMLGYGLLLTSVRTGDSGLADAGLRALEYSLDRAARSPSTQVFHQLAVVSAYNLAREHFAANPIFVRARGRWEDVMRRIEVYRLGKREITNKSIVESVLLTELLHSGLSSDQPGTALADPTGTLAVVKRFLGTDLPKADKPYERSGRAVLGDMPLLPPAYHGLSVGMLGRAVTLLGDQAPSAARSLLRRAAAASLALAGPDGEVAYHGRSQSQAWTLSLTGYGAEVAAGQPGASALAPAFRGLAERTIGRLAQRYSTGSEGFLVTPALAQSIDAAIPGLDEYVAAASYVGLTLSTLEWAIGAAGDGSAGGVPSGMAVLGGGSGSWATSRSGSVWFAVKQARTSVRDLRYDAGLMALKVRGSGGAWRDVVPLRPRTLKGDQSAGPVLGGGVPEFATLERGRGGSTVARGGFRTRSGRWVRKGVTFTYAAVSCGVRISWAARKGERYAYSGFFAGPPAVKSKTVSDDEQIIRFDSPVTVSKGSNYSSGSDARLTRVTARFKRGRDGTAAIAICSR
jgi:hypothetical protein